MRSALTHLRVRSLAVLGRRLASLAHPRQPSCRLGHPEQRRVTAREANVAVRAEPSSVGTSRARDRLALEIRLLGALLGQVIAEQAGVELLDLVERVRRTTIRLRREDDAAEREASPRCWPASTSTARRSSSGRSASTSGW